LTRNPERLENPGFPIKDFGNDEKSRCSIIWIVKNRGKGIKGLFGKDWNPERRNFESDIKVRRELIIVQRADGNILANMLQKNPKSGTFLILKEQT
jgi:hypothetical protein